MGGIGTRAVIVEGVHHVLQVLFCDLVEPQHPDKNTKKNIKKMRGQRPSRNTQLCWSVLQNSHVLATTAPEDECQVGRFLPCEIKHKMPLSWYKSVNFAFDFELHSLERLLNAVSFNYASAWAQHVLSQRQDFVREGGERAGCYQPHQPR